MNNIEILADSARGVYIPQHFAETCEPEKWGIDQDDIQTLLADPELEYYWDTWDWVLNNAERTDSSGNIWRLHQDGDLFAYCPSYWTASEFHGLFGSLWYCDDQAIDLADDIIRRAGKTPDDMEVFVDEVSDAIQENGGVVEHACKGYLIVKDGDDYKVDEL